MISLDLRRPARSASLDAVFPLVSDLLFPAPRETRYCTIFSVLARDDSDWAQA